VAVDQCKNSKQIQIMKAISSTLGSGAIKNVQLQDVIHEDWVELLSLDLQIKTSPEFVDEQWHCAEGITNDTMTKLNEEFNHFRGLFPLKVYIGGPPIAGKTHFATKLAQAYGIPHLKIADMIQEA
jgi:adenylate kinase